MFPRTGRNDLFVAPVNRDTNKNVCPHIAAKPSVLFGKVCRFFILNFLRAFIVKCLLLKSRQLPFRFGNMEYRSTFLHHP